MQIRSLQFKTQLKKHLPRESLKACVILSQHSNHKYIIVIINKYSYYIFELASQLGAGNSICW